jgi:hypothetical protein
VPIFDHPVVIGARHVDLSDLNFFAVHGVSDRETCVAREYVWQETGSVWGNMENDKDRCW